MRARLVGPTKSGNRSFIRRKDDDLATPPVRTADFEYWRLRKPPNSLNQVAKMIAANATGTDLFVYLKRGDSRENALLAAEFLRDTSRPTTSGTSKR
jgi:hypothetical protein